MQTSSTLEISLIWRFNIFFCLCWILLFKRFWCHLLFEILLFLICRIMGSESDSWWLSRSVSPVFLTKLFWRTLDSKYLIFRCLKSIIGPFCFGILSWSLSWMLRVLVKSLYIVALLDRGWRRSGCFVYKPEMERTCCPSYTIRLEASEFVPTKEQLRVSKRVQRFSCVATPSISSCLFFGLSLNVHPRQRKVWAKLT